MVVSCLCVPAGRLRLPAVPRWPAAGVMTTRAGPQETHGIRLGRRAESGPAARAAGAGGGGVV